MMKVVYVAGPFRARNQWQIAENIRAAERIGFLVAMAGAMPLIPHANTANFHGIGTDEFWLEGTMELLKRCDGAVFLPGWRTSSGSLGEWKACGKLLIPHTSLDEHMSSDFPSVVGGFVYGLNYAKEDNAEEQRDTPQATGD